MIVGAILLIPLIQIGVSFWASFASIITIATIWKFRAAFANNVPKYLHLYIAFMLMFLSILSFHPKDFMQEVLRISREGMFFVLIVIAIYTFEHRNVIRRIDGAVVAVLCISIAMFMISFIQMNSYKNGVYFGFPQDWFVTNQNTIANENDLIFTRENLRPSGTFGEPSYLAFIMLSFIFMLAPIARMSKIASIAILMCILTGAVSRSLAFFLSLPVVYFVPSFIEARISVKIRLIVVSVLLISVSFIFEPVMITVSRLSEVSAATGDVSTFSRIVAPVLILPEFIFTYPLGVAAENLADAVSPISRGLIPDVGEFFNNGFANLFFEYGIVGFLLASIILRSTSDIRVRCYILYSSIFNGAFLHIDKVGIFILTLAMYRASKQVIFEESLGGSIKNRPRGKFSIKMAERNGA
ncbi:hypothetical protein EDE12_11148 [Methylosinus sp. sav-2]|uniref:hypothetical protein n=1 Tax=Methylosinus sp. sav-2 TaxID=2485168 RepID=UPI001066F3BA|nr:hypothetical protein [Methylosinus sp. sav-2]TDX62142.1 hypothetical protein EDE12_11148 [Methylosinus sp. sav-2]